MNQNYWAFLRVFFLAMPHSILLSQLFGSASDAAASLIPLGLYLHFLSPNIYLFISLDCSRLHFDPFCCRQALV